MGESPTRPEVHEIKGSQDWRSTTLNIGFRVTARARVGIRV